MLQHFRRVSVLNLEEFLWKVTSQKGLIKLWHSDTYFLILIPIFTTKIMLFYDPPLIFQSFTTEKFSHKMNIYELRNDIPPSMK